MVQNAARPAAARRLLASTAGTGRSSRRTREPSKSASSADDLRRRPGANQWPTNGKPAGPTTSHRAPPKWRGGVPAGWPGAGPYHVSLPEYDVLLSKPGAGAGAARTRPHRHGAHRDFVGSRNAGSGIKKPGPSRRRPTARPQNGAVECRRTAGVAIIPLRRRAASGIEQGICRLNGQQVCPGASARVAVAHGSACQGRPHRSRGAAAGTGAAFGI
jgi:hypothetical protein